MLVAAAAAVAARVGIGAVVYRVRREKNNIFFHRILTMPVTVVVVVVVVGCVEEREK
jgi:hypothetical protein